MELQVFRHTYFARAKVQLVDVSFLLELCDHLIHWIFDVLPRMKSYREYGDTGFFLHIFPNLETEHHRKITQLHLSDAQGFHDVKVDFPNLRTLYLSHFSPEASNTVSKLFKGWSMPHLTSLRFGFPGYMRFTMVSSRGFSTISNGFNCLSV